MNFADAGDGRAEAGRECGRGQWGVGTADATSGSLSRSSLRRRSSEAGERVSPAMSSIMPARLRMLPAASRMPGCSWLGCAVAEEFHRRGRSGSEGRRSGR